MKYASDHFKLKIPAGSIKQVGDTIELVELRDTPGNIKIIITFSRTIVSGELHRYSLTITVSSLCNSEVHLKELALLWPPSVRISYLNNVSFRSDVNISGEIFNEYVISIDEPISPGQTLGLIGFGERGTIYYEYDVGIYRRLMEKPRDLQCILRAQGWPVIYNKKPFSELNIF